MTGATPADIQRWTPAIGARDWRRLLGHATVDQQPTDQNKNEEE